MKKRFFCMLLALCMMTALLSVGSLAADQQTILQKLKGYYAEQILEEETGESWPFHIEISEPHLDTSWGDDEFTFVYLIDNRGLRTVEEVGVLIYDDEGNIIQNLRAEEADGDSYVTLGYGEWIERTVPLYAIDENGLYPRQLQLGQTLHWRIYAVSGRTQYLSGERSYVVTAEGSRFEDAVHARVENPFVDVKPGDYFYEPVLWALNHHPQITDGTTETTFSPNATCTRAQIVTFLWRAMGCQDPDTSRNPFRDVKTSDYYYKAVLWAVNHGITDGTSANTFSPDQPCTRGQVVTFLQRAEGAAAMGASPFDGSVPVARNMNVEQFRDVDTGAYYASAVQWALRSGVTDGTSDTTFSPDDPCTRGQIVTFLSRSLT